MRTHSAYYLLPQPEGDQSESRGEKISRRTLAALREYDRLIKSLYVLEYVDSQTLRQFVQHALNRGDACHHNGISWRK
ncbi:MAG: Tn3 family transposase [Morganella morganii]